MEHHPTRGGWSMLASPAVASAMATTLDWVALDAQHGEHDDASVRMTCALLAGVATPVYVRTASDDPAGIGRALDSGATGVIVPLIEDVRSAADAVAACRYPPLGNRSWGPLGALYGRPVPSASTAAPECFVMIETAAGLDDVVAIAATSGLTGILVGPVDLSLSLGVPLDALIRNTAPDAPLRRVAEACQAAGIVPAVFAGTIARTAALADLGYSMIAVTTDSGALQVGLDAAAAR